MLRYLTAGESHGPQLTGIIEGMPAGVPLSSEYVSLQLARRQQGYGRGGRMAFEQDMISFLSGVRFSKSMGGPIAMAMPNKAFHKDRADWPRVMAAEGSGEGIEPITLPRPGHADLVGDQKYGYNDIRPVIERSSARETAMRVACCAVAREFLKGLGIEIGGHVVHLNRAGYTNWNAVRAQVDPILTEKGAEALFNQADESEVRCLNPELSDQMVDEIRKAKKAGTSLGGIYEIVVSGVPAGLGSFVHWDRKLDGRLAQVILGTQAMKGVEIGYGFEAGKHTGAEVHDEIAWEGETYTRKTNRAGGIEGGMSTGQPIIIRGVMKPIPTMLKPLKTVDTISKKEEDTRYERSDVCALPRAVVVAENAIAPVIADAVMERYGSDRFDLIKERMQADRSHA